ncbi:hexokinase-2-like isoform X3 [Varroa jacobsoni]|uniref:Phosphotransferase n=1 Tax=Varroa destructor TaxID=109461 RepID=A0A7M7KNH8_VARDE|nr:hexokinase-2-like isoform X4 [Varroa destructor]XP_022686283.1 hexokinase-2-like isoform X3 [Varroa jacobsoni]
MVLECGLDWAENKAGDVHHQIQQRLLRRQSTMSTVEAITRELELSNDTLEKVMTCLLKELNNGLNKETHAKADVKQYITYVRDVPDGSESGRFLALDLGGTNFRVLLIEIDGDKFKMDNAIYAVPQEIMLGTGTQLFDHIAECLATFSMERGIYGQRLPLGFTFSFPCRQEGLTRARLVTWTKGFKCSGVEGEDVVKLLREAIARRGDVQIDVMAVVNDTTGTLMSCAHRNKECRLGVIVGTGANACYMERIENCQLWDGDDKEPRQVIINTEWGAFGDNGVIDFIRTQYDIEVDEHSLNPSHQKFEKMISGMYMGELARRVVVRLANEHLIFNGRLSQKMKTPYAFKTKYISEIESDQKGCFDETRKVLAKLDQIGSDDDCQCLKLVVSRVSSRAAHLVSAAIATVLNKMKRPHTTVGVDGSVYRYHPKFHQLMEAKIAELTNPDYKFDLMLSEDGSGRGAALVAAVAVRNIQRGGRSPCMGI